MTRRVAITVLGAASLAAQTSPAPNQVPSAPAGDTTPRFGRSAPKRTSPMLCVYSQNMIRVPYAQLGEIAAQIGFEGVDLTVMIGGHVDPRVTNVDLVRAFESVRGAGLEVPMVSTSITTVMDPGCYGVLYLTGHSQVPLFRLGYWPYGTAPIQQRLGQVRQEFAQILGLCPRCEIAALWPNRAGGFVGQSVWDAQTILGDTDPHWSGYYFDPAEATAEGGSGAWEIALRLSLPRLKAVALQDFYWAKEGTAWTIRKCPLGEGMVDFGKFFPILAAAHFTGPVSIHMEYAAKDAPGAMAKDLEFARKGLSAAGY